MPPTDGANGSKSPPLSRVRTPPPTLKPFLDNLPPPILLNSAENTPRRVERRLADDATPTKGKHLALDGNEGNDEEESDENESDQQEADDDDELDDDEFESHYSRQDSPASSDSEDGEEESGSESIAEMPSHSANNSTIGGPIQRVSSMPTSLPQYSGQTGLLHTSHSTTSLSRAAPPIPPPLYPPFYNRPPTPLPPSPSLSSLLRPPSLLNRSATSTRPTTPDSSDAETPNDTEAAVAQSARRANPLPPTAPKVPTYEYYGFVLYLASSLAFLIYILWSFLPSNFLHFLGITYYPNRWWSLAIPAWIVIVLVYIYVALACWNVEYLTLGLQRLETMVDDAGNVAILDDNGRIRKGGSKRFEWEAEERKKRERATGGGSWSRKGKGSNKKKDQRKRHRDEMEQHRFGYMGELADGKVISGLTWGQIWNEGTDAVMDIPIGGVCEVLYGEPGLAA